MKKFKAGRLLATSSVVAVVIFALASADALAAHPERKSDANRSSKNGRLETAIGEVNILLTYGRPKQNGRPLWGQLVPYGKIWRVGADEATAITFSAPVKIAGKQLDAGTYALFAVPKKGGWTWVLNRDAAQWGAYRHDRAKDALRVEVEPSSAAKATDELTFEAEAAGLKLRWGTLAVPLPISAK